jgi:hypothetical protein
LQLLLDLLQVADATAVLLLVVSRLFRVPDAVGPSKAALLSYSCDRAASAYRALQLLRHTLGFGLLFDFFLLAHFFAIASNSLPWRLSTPARARCSGARIQSMLGIREKTTNAAVATAKALAVRSNEMG